MLEVTLLGTGGMLPLPDRYLTSLMVRYRGSAILVDCGEGTQMALRAAGLSCRHIEVICLTHFHADHIAGLPGLLLTIGHSGRTEPLLIAGPRHVDRVVECLRIIAPQLPFEVRYAQIEQPGELLTLEDLTLSCCEVEHWIPCYAYRFDLRRSGKFDPQRARSLGIPVRYWSTLQRGEPVELDGEVVSPDAVLGPPRRGIRLCYATDLRPSDALVEFAAQSDLFICEGMYGDPDLLDKAVEHRHCLFTEAARMAGRAQVSELWLTHYSPAMPDPEQYTHHASALFDNVHIGERSTLLTFADS